MEGVGIKRDEAEKKKRLKIGAPGSEEKKDDGEVGWLIESLMRREKTVLAGRCRAYYRLSSWLTGLGNALEPLASSPRVPFARPDLPGSSCVLVVAPTSDEAKKSSF